MIIGLRNFPKHTWRLLMSNRSGRQVDSCLLLLTNLILPFCALQAQTSSSVDHFSWSTPPSTVQAGQPLAVVIQARGLDNNLAPNFNGSAMLTALVAAQNAKLLIT